MAEAIAGALLTGLAAYAALGLAFALAFAARGVKGGTLGFRIVIIPGAAAFWPFLLWRWLRGEASR